jgi:hypothetical protein
MLQCWKVGSKVLSALMEETFRGSFLVVEGGGFDKADKVWRSGLVRSKLSPQKEVSAASTSRNTVLGKVPGIVVQIRILKARKSFNSLGTGVWETRKALFTCPTD